MLEDRATDRIDVPPRSGTDQARGGIVPELSFEAVAPTLQQAEQMTTGLRILARWLLRRHRQATAAPHDVTEDRERGIPENPLTSGPARALMCPCETEHEREAQDGRSRP